MEYILQINGCMILIFYIITLFIFVWYKMIINHILLKAKILYRL